MVTVPPILAAVVLMVVGQVLVKKGLNLLGDIDFSGGFIGAYSQILTSFHVIAGAFCYIVAVFFWLYALSKVDLSYAYPFVALSYVLIIFSSWIFLGESISILRWMGVLVICFGVFLVSRS